MILNNPLKFDYDLENDEDPELYTYSFDLKILEKISKNIYSESVWKSVKKALNDFTPEQMPDFVIFCGDDFYEGLPVSYQIGIFGNIETNLHISLMREFEKHKAFSEFYTLSTECLVPKYRFYKKKVYIYNNSETKSYNAYDIGRQVLPRYLLHEDWL
ncbi:hypothetical protein ACO2KH_01880 [Leptospira terpstrae]|uniref:hypothetical protein n=1 Tax=Leptospira terpstrae TaxID=293075 RepID=UPI003D06138E